MIYYILTVIITLLIAPLILGFIKAFKMVLLYKKPSSIFQPYRNYSKLLSKEMVISQESSNITKTTIIVLRLNAIV